MADTAIEPRAFVDEWSDNFEKYMAFEKCTRKEGESVEEFMKVWESCYAKVKAGGCEMSDLVLAYKLLRAMNLKEIDCKMVLTDVDYAKGKAEKNLLALMQASCKKLVGRVGIQSNNHELAVKEESKDDLNLSENILMADMNSINTRISPPLFPAEIWEMVLKHVTLTDLSRVGRVCYALRNISVGKKLWGKVTINLDDTVQTEEAADQLVLYMEQRETKTLIVNHNSRENQCGKRGRFHGRLFYNLVKSKTIVIFTKSQMSNANIVSEHIVMEHRNPRCVPPNFTDSLKYVEDNKFLHHEIIAKEEAEFVALRKAYKERKLLIAKLTTEMKEMEADIEDVEDEADIAVHKAEIAKLNAELEDVSNMFQMAKDEAIRKRKAAFDLAKTGNSAYHFRDIEPISKVTLK